MKMVKDMPEHARPRENLREWGSSALKDMQPKMKAKLPQVWAGHTASGGSNA